jgi:hypothetical protein
VRSIGVEQSTLDRLRRPPDPKVFRRWSRDNPELEMLRFLSTGASEHPALAGWYEFAGAADATLGVLSGVRRHGATAGS